jgi:ABC-type phosphate/phosphonate transport system substrate-binding protein
LKSSLRSSGIQDVTVFVARDLSQMRDRIQQGRLDFIFTSAFPVIELERQKLVPAVVALQGGEREDTALFFVREESFLQHLSDLRGTTVAFGTSSSTAGYAMAMAELKMNRLSAREWTDKDAPEDAIRYRFAGEAINQAFRVIRSRADAGVFSSSDWEELPLNIQSQLRVIHRTAPITRLLGSFHRTVSPALREVVERTLVEMSGDREGRAALSAALHMTKFERLKEEDRRTLEDLKQQMSEPDAE